MISFVTILSAVLGLTSALTLPSPLEKRSCSYLYQPTLYGLSQHLPEATDGPRTTPFSVGSDIGKKDLLVSFRYIPDTAYGCQLEFDYKPGHNAFVSQQVGDPTVINVFRVSDGGNFPFGPTWDNTNARMGPLIGTWHFPGPSELGTPVVRVIANFACSPIQTFRFTVADPNARGGVQVDEDAVSGLRISYSC
jgi:hypothetical protein